MFPHVSSGICGVQEAIDMNWLVLQKKRLKKLAVLCAVAMIATLCAGSALAATIETVSPENVTIHLFDYWITDDSAGPDGAGRFVWDSQLPVGHLETGINRGHAFKFGGSGSALQGSWRPNDDGTYTHVTDTSILPWSNAGYWNKGVLLIHIEPKGDYGVKISLSPE